MGASTDICKILLLLCLMNQVYRSVSLTISIYPVKSQNLAQRFLRCKNGEYVKSTDFCDGANDCTDGSDEPSQCKSENCGLEGKFLCASSSNSTNFTCILPKLLCDTRKDCSDGSDEANCGDEVKIQDCPLSKGKFLCKDNLRCLDLEYTCDGYCNCFDCSDETKNCTKRDEKSLAKCTHSYFPTPSGLRCFCNSNDGTFDDLCKEMKECPAKNSCDQRCTQYKNKMLCSCYDDFTEIMVTNGFKCRSKEYHKTQIIYSTSNYIKALNITTKQATVIKKNVHCKLLAAAQGVIYYTTYRNNGTIFMISSDKTTEIITADSYVNSMIVDYITDNLYFTTSKHSLSVCSKNGQICTQLKCCDVGHVTVAPKFGWMFYTKESEIPNEYFIIKSNMDGSDDNILIDGTLRGIVTITIDESFARLYLQDSSGISSISLHDYSIEKHYIKLGHDPESLMVLDEILFYTVNRDDRIYQQETLERFVKSPISTDIDDELALRGYRYYEYNSRPTDSNHTVYKAVNATISIKNIAVFNSIRQLNSKVKNPCKSACPNLCLLRPISTLPKDIPGHVCVCDDFSPSDEGQWCTDSSLLTNPSVVDAIDENPTSENSFSFVEISFALIALAALLGGGYILYQKYYNTVIYSKGSRHRSDRILEADQCEI